MFSANRWLWSVNAKAGVDDVALLARWAIENGLDEAILLGSPMPKVKPKRGRKVSRWGGSGGRGWTP